jgi:5'-nucleotidase
VSQPPLILVTNDDGILSPGLRAAAEAVAGLGELLLAAPATQQTSMSRAFSHDTDAGVIERVEMRVGGRAVPAYAVSGSPALTVTHAVLELAERPVGLCVSGVNYGENIGGSIGVSGTVGAALEAANHGIPGIVRDQVASVTPLTWRMTADTDWKPPGQ